VAGFIAFAKVIHGPSVADNHNRMEIFRSGGRGSEKGAVDGGQGNFDLLLAAARAEMGSGRKSGQIVKTADARAGGF